MFILIVIIIIVIIIINLIPIESGGFDVHFEIVSDGIDYHVEGGAVFFPGDFIVSDKVVISMP